MKRDNLFKFLIVVYFLFSSFISNVFAQKPTINKVEPPNWWANHSYSNVQLLVYGKNLSSVKVNSLDEKIKIENVVHSNDDHIFIYINLTKSAFPGKYKFTFTNGEGIDTLIFQLFNRDSVKNIHQGFSNEDVVYLIFPDRFVNGDQTNDFLFNDKEEFEFRSLNGRHGGDIQGIIDKLDYLKELGITTIWVTPLLENNTYMSYHGYAATNLYKVDPRFGTNNLYQELVKKAHDKGLKIIYDHVSNHIGINHEWVSNLPTETWINGAPNNHLPADHNKVALVDIHADKKSITDIDNGWFVDTMPDLNQTDSLLAKYIIQNTIWWIEYSGIDGIREDTYPYSNQKFMSVWAKTILEHYQNFNIVGEVWKGEPAILAAFQRDSYFPNELNTNLPAVTDFAIRDALYDYMSGKSDLQKIYETFGEDFVYSDLNNLLVFFDNHDIDRAMFDAKGDIAKYKQALTIVLTSRGIPQIFYGTEIGLDGGGHHGKIRAEFPGGFSNDSINAFTKTGRTEKQNEIFNFTQKLLHLRKDYSALRKGKLTQYPPKENIYVYKKVLESEEIIIFLNGNNDEKEIQ
ncbi:MAG: cyclomaltodextrinase N-terminal domain-containing protein, partial [Ignavibacteriae bacterium]|nr:cyclomaltodextrinase N-terminal domain-containing protein [Ignavibacteriota bacterium]